MSEARYRWVIVAFRPFAQAEPKQATAYSPLCSGLCNTSPVIPGEHER
jgi:hypothetical protein